jgi:hypothetical protein
MDGHEVLAAFDQQVRRHREVDVGPGSSIERERAVTRIVAPDGGWQGVSWSDLDDEDADEVIAAQVVRFAETARSWEWKHYSHDQPSDLPERLLAAGFVQEEPEALLFAQIEDLAFDPQTPAGVGLAPVVDAEGVAAMVALQNEVFGGDNDAVGRELLAALGRDPVTASAVVAFAGGEPIAAGRIEFHPGTDFAALYGGGTVDGWRKRGVFRALVAHRAALAAAGGFRYLQVDASPASRPIFKRLGFVELGTTTPFKHPGTR